MPSGPECLYCGAPATRDDPAIPAWVLRLTGLAGSPVEHLLASGEPLSFPALAAGEEIPVSVPRHAAASGRSPLERLHRAIDEAIEERTELAAAEYAARCLCEPCALVLASRDEAVLPLLEPMVTGSAARFSLAEQRLLAGWGARAAYAILAAEGRDEGVPPRHRHELREHGIPHPDVYVGLGRYRANHVGVLAARLELPLGEERPTEAYSVLAVLGHLTLKVFGVHSRPNDVRVASPRGTINRVWPPRDGELPWPPLWTLTQQTLDQAFLQEPFRIPIRELELRYEGPNVRTRAKRRRTEGPGPRR
ncbi:MAG: hypothetical protein IT201_03620 [Thermoleophilia bacterium]|nr:hypothetical protein [Thermoleophilia bacterium]